MTTTPGPAAELGMAYLPDYGVTQYVIRRADGTYACPWGAKIVVELAPEQVRSWTPVHPDNPLDVHMAATPLEATPADDTPADGHDAGH